MQAQAAVIQELLLLPLTLVFQGLLSEAGAAVMLARVFLPFKHIKIQDVLPKDAEKLGDGERAMRVTEGLESKIYGESLGTLPLELSHVIRKQNWS